MSKPTIRELLDDNREESLELLADRVEAVLKLHKESTEGATYCEHCHMLQPCPTIRTLNGEKL